MTLNRDGFGMHTRHDTIALLSDWSLERSAVLLGILQTDWEILKAFRLNGRFRRNLLHSLMNILGNLLFIRCYPAGL